MPRRTKHWSRVSCQTVMLTACRCRLCWDCLTTSRRFSQGLFLSAQTGLYSLQLAWDTFDALADTPTSQRTAFCVKMCAPSQPLTENCSFARSRPSEGSMLETSSRLGKSRNFTEFPLCRRFIPPIQTFFCVIHARTWQNTLSF